MRKADCGGGEIKSQGELRSSKWMVVVVERKGGGERIGDGLLVQEPVQTQAAGDKAGKR